VLCLCLSGTSCRTCHTWAGQTLGRGRRGESCIAWDRELLRRRCPGHPVCSCRSCDGIRGVESLAGHRYVPFLLNDLLSDKTLVAVPTLHLLSPLSQSPFRTIKLRPRSKACLVCCLVAPPPTLSESRRVTLTPTLAAAAFDHLRQTGEYPWSDPLCTLPTPANKAGTQLRWSASELSKLIDPGGVPVGSRLIDVRSPTEFGICRIEGSLSMYHHALA
jgi:hypothetical protein